MASPVERKCDTYLSDIQRVIINFEADIVASQVDRESDTYHSGI